MPGGGGNSNELRLSAQGGGGPCAMEGGELAAEGMDTLTELGDELTLGDIDGRCREKEREVGWRWRAWAPHAFWGERSGFPMRARGCWGRRHGWVVLGSCFWSVQGRCDSNAVRAARRAGGSRDPLSRAVQVGVQSASRRATLAWQAAARVSPARGVLLSDFSWRCPTPGVETVAAGRWWGLGVRAAEPAGRRGTGSGTMLTVSLSFCRRPAGQAALPTFP